MTLSPPDIKLINAYYRVRRLKWNSFLTGDMPVGALMDHLNRISEVAGELSSVSLKRTTEGAIIVRATFAGSEQVTMIRLAASAASKAQK